MLVFQLQVYRAIINGCLIIAVVVRKSANVHAVAYSKRSKDLPIATSDWELQLKRRIDW